MSKDFKGKISIRLGLIAFIATGGGLIISTILNEESFYKIEILIIFGIFFTLSLWNYYQKMKHKQAKIIFTRKSFYILLCTLISGSFTWFLNHKMGYSAVISNGLVGVMAATLLPNDLAGIAYTSSFVGMSSLAVIPSLPAAALGSLIVGLVILTTAPIYAGMGGKGGTTAALSTQITRIILKVFS